MKNGHHRLLVQIEHAPRDLHGPVDQHVRGMRARGAGRARGGLGSHWRRPARAVERSAAGKLKHQAEKCCRRHTPRSSMMLGCRSMEKSRASRRTLSAAAAASCSGSQRAAFTATSWPCQVARYTCPETAGADEPFVPAARSRRASRAAAAAAVWRAAARGGRPGGTAPRSWRGRYRGVAAPGRPTSPHRPTRRPGTAPPPAGRGAGSARPRRAPRSRRARAYSPALRRGRAAGGGGRRRRGAGGGRPGPGIPAVRRASSAPGTWRVVAKGENRAAGLSSWAAGGAHRPAGSPPAPRKAGNGSLGSRTMRVHWPTTRRPRLQPPLLLCCLCCCGGPRGRRPCLHGGAPSLRPARGTFGLAAA